MNDDDRRLAQRLRAYESRVPDAPAPSTAFGGGRAPWGIAAVGAAAILAGAYIASNMMNEPNVGEGDTTPTPSVAAEPTLSGSPSPSATPDPSVASSPSVSPATPVPTTPPQAAIAGVAWDDAAAATEDGEILRITAERGRFFALGSIPGTAVIWSSTDGATWQRSDLPFPSEWEFPEISFVSVHELASVGNSLVAIGSIVINDYAEVVVWESTDGTTWREIDTGEFRGDAYWINDVTNGPGSLVAISSQYAQGADSAWRSADGGATWTEHRPHGESLALSAVVGTGRGYLVVGGEAVATGDATAPRIWYSPDGMGSSWVPADLEGSVRHGLVEQLAIDGSGRWVAVGNLDGRIVTWRSTNRGVSWSIAADLGPIGSSGRAEYQLAGTPGGFIAVGGNPTQTWTSADGQAWVSEASPALPTDTTDRARGIGRVGDLVVVAGPVSATERNRWQAWIGVIE